MKVRQHGENFIQVTQMGFVNFYLVREEDGFTLVDAGTTEGIAPQILKIAQGYNLPIVRLLLTHVHVDHVGALDSLHDLLPDAEVLVGARESRFLAGDMSLDKDEPQDQLRGGWPARKTRPTRLIHEGERVGSLEVIATPGHTPGHLSFLDTRDRTLIAGDAFQTMAKVAVTGTFVLLFPLVAPATWHKGLALESARKLRALEPTRLSAGHGPVVKNPLAAMDRAIEYHARKYGQSSLVAATQ
ncbi:MBL fold metallo-hydrolase [Ktedonobacter sp. SOSP1-52]|uniref:MBL fold metallo-hydrolase n=1 Tax=Ktedonobacter sp. SOSP1-52 TaxID=2778366 RepID=UPI00191602BA|nr:MBL fold metallo-hydrolase [Ktedonobacter sp. SOSP1-52]GHO65757.1 MBL fold metallo-hydrolase [Ktedonobacter sp. SOSP1-52]